MNTVLYFSINGAVYETRAYTKADIDTLIADQSLQSLTSGDRQFDFWFSPTTDRCQRRINRRATELLLATTTFTPKDVPLLRGCVVIATHDEDGDLDGLSWQQLDLLIERSRALSAREQRALTRRVNREDARAPRKVQPVPVAPVSCARARRSDTDPTPPHRLRTVRRWTSTNTARMTPPAWPSWSPTTR